MLINIINRAISLVWRITKLFLSLIMCGVCFVVFMFMAVCVIVIIFGGKNHDFWQNKPGNESEEGQN